jgi:hypothetical protein
VEQKMNYIEKGEVYPATDDERVKLSSFIGKRITAIKYDASHNKFEFWSGKGRQAKLMFVVESMTVSQTDNIFDCNGNWFNTDDLLKK